MGYFNRFGVPKTGDCLRSLVDETGKMVTGGVTDALSSNSFHYLLDGGGIGNVGDDP